MTWDEIAKLISTGVGAYAGAQAGQPSTTTQTTAMTPQMQGQWDAYQTFANNVANRPYQNTVAPFTEDQYQSMDMVRNAAMNGTPEVRAGSEALQGFLGGGAQNPYMSFNPWTNGMMQNTADLLQNRMGSAAFNSGSFGNSGVQYTGAKALADSANQLQYGAYRDSANLAENALNRTANMIPQALAYGQVPFQNANMLMQSGAMQQAQGQKMTDNWWNYPMQQLNLMGQPLQLGTGQTQTINQPGNTWASALGGGLLGWQLGNGFTPPTTTQQR